MRRIDSSEVFEGRLWINAEDKLGAVAEKGVPTGLVASRSKELTGGATESGYAVCAVTLGRKDCAGGKNDGAAMAFFGAAAVVVGKGLARLDVRGANDVVDAPDGALVEL